MLAGSERQQGFLDAAWCAGLLAENSIYAVLARHGDRIVRDQDFAECYSARWGRPSIPPSLLAKVLLLAYRDGLSDRRAMEALRFDLRWKVALDLPIDHPGFHPTSLVKFRARLLLHGRNGSCSSARWSWPPSSGCSTGQSSRLLTPRRCSAPPRSRTRSRWSAPRSA